MAETIEDKTIFSLLEVSKSIQKTLADRYKSVYWIKAEMNKLNYYSHSGHCYPELVEKSQGKIVAEIRSILWKTDYNRINQQFLRITGEPLREGITMLFQAAISYDPLYGLSLRIVDIDSTFVLGELEKERQESIRKLHEEGLFGRNKTRILAVLPKRLAIISVESSKGLSDFYKIIQQNPWHYRLETTLYPALLQGDKSIASIIQQLAVIAQKTHLYDAVAIIRGGGGEVGLSSYNNYFLARAIATFPIPVLTGIGHSTNETVSEMVAYKNAITPSELADFLLQHFHNFAVPLARAQEELVRHSRQLLLEQEAQIQQMANQVNWSTQVVVSREKNKVDSFQKELKIYSTQLLKEQFAQLTFTAKIVQLADPAHLLKRGYSISQVNGVLLKDIGQIQRGDIIETTVQNGKLLSQVIQ